MGNRKKRTPGPQQHAEGQHGERTHKRFIELLQGTGENGGDEVGDNIIRRAPIEGRSRLDEDREQHDEAEKGSEKVKVPHESDSD